MTTPSIVPTNRSGTYRDYLQTKVDRSGAVRTEGFSVSVPGSTATTTIVGLVPFNRGFRLDYSASQIATSGLGASVTVDIGYVYDLNATYTNDQDAFGSAVSASAAGAINFDEPVTGVAFVAEDNGWIVVTIGGAATTGTQTITGQIVGVYDGLQLVNR